MLSFACGTRDKVHMRRPAPAALRGSHPKCAEQSSACHLFLSAQERRKFDTGRSPSPDAVDAKRTPTPHRDRKVPGAARAPAATYELYREFRTNRRPLNVASVVSRTVRAGKFICGRWRPGSAGDRTSTTTASCSDRRRRRTARFHLGRIYGGQPLRSWRRCRCTPKAVAPLRGSPDAQAS